VDEALPYTTASGLLKQPDKQKSVKPAFRAANTCLGLHKLQNVFGWAGFGVILRASQGWP